MESIVALIKSVFLGIIQGITEWLPISSTGHMILFSLFFALDENQFVGGREFVELFLIVIQFGSILAVILLYFKKINFLSTKISNFERKRIVNLWLKIFVGMIPTAIVGFVFKDLIHKYLYSGFVVAVMLVVYGILFLLIENLKIKKKWNSINSISYLTAFKIGIFQSIALIPGTSRSGATILGALLLGCSRDVGAEFSFFLAIPTMCGASFFSILSYFKHTGRFGFTLIEFLMLFVGSLVAFIVSMVTITKFMSYIKKKNFNVFAWYRIIIGLILILLISFSVIKI